MEFHGGDKVEVCSEEEGFLGSYDAATTAKNLVEEEDMSKHLIETHHKPSAKTHRWSTLLNSLNLRTHPTPKPLTHALKPSPPLLLIFFFFKPNPFLVDGATILFVTISNARFLLDAENQNHIRMLQVIQGVLVLGKVLILRDAGFVLGCPYPSSLFGGYRLSSMLAMTIMPSALIAIFLIMESGSAFQSWEGCVVIVALSIFHTPEGMLSSEQGVYVAESVASKNTRQAKGRFRMYEDHNDTDDVNSNQFVKREPTGREAAGMGRKDIGKSTKKADKGKTTKEEARELLLKEEAAVRDKVRGIQDNLSMMLRALGEMAISNPVFAHSQLPSLVCVMQPAFLCVTFVDVYTNSYQDVQPHLCHWALDIATTLRLIVTKDVSVFLDLIPIAGDREANESPSLGLFERIINGLDIWDRYGHDFGTNYSGLFKALSHIDYNVRLAAAEALAAALDENPDTIQESLSTLFSLYIRDAGFGEDTVDAGWLGRQGIALALHSAADVLRTKDLPVVMTFLISRALGDLNADVRGRMINAGIIIIDKHGRDNVSLLFPIFENYLNKKASAEEKYDLVREGVVIFTGALAKHLAKDDPKVHAVVEKLLDVLNTPSEAVQRAVSFCLSPLMQSKKDDAPALVSRLLDQLMNSEKFGERRGAAFGLAGVVKGMEYLARRIREAAECAARSMMSQLSAQGLKLVLPSILKVLTDTHPKVQSAGQMALQQVRSVIKNPEISSLVPTLLIGLTYPNEYTKYSLDILLQVKEPKDMIPYIGLLLPEVKKVLVDAIPEVRSRAARAIGSLIRGMGEENFPDLVPWMFDSLKTDNSNVERSGAAQGLSEVLSALGTGYFEHVLPDIIRNCSHQKASMRDGYLTLFKYLPRSLGVQFQNYLQQVLPATLDGLADENESVRDAALGADHVLVEHYATMSLPLLFPAVEDGIFNDNWCIRQSSVELLRDLLFKVAGTSGKSDEGSSTEAHGRAIIEVLGRDKRNEILAALYMVRTDVNLSVRQAPLHVWKRIVANTPKTLKEIMPVLMNTLISSLASSSSERRQVAARALGELVRKLGERDASFDHPNPIPDYVYHLSVGAVSLMVFIKLPLIRIIGDRFPWQVKSAILSILSILIRKGGMSLRPFLPQLQTTFIKCLQDSTRTVRTSAAFSLGKLSALSTRVDPPVSDLLSSLQASDAGVREAILTALKGVLKHAGKSVSDPIRVRVFSQLKDLIHHDDDQVRISAASILGITSPVGLGTAQYSPSSVVTSQMFPSIIHCLKDALKDEKVLQF
ncbi:hypothetical protein D5086_029448 [Populus alba]|uniref:Uncharacterized protein n=1 Tax=Populus alba TaxID=43335 RepID=A0ACC4ATL1_POPAL